MTPTRPSWDNYWMVEAALIASRSKDPSTKVGAVLIEPDGKRLIAKGYNGLPQGVPDTDARLAHRPTKLALTIHAELNAILFARRDLLDCILYSTQPPCSHCAAVIIQTGIGRVVYPNFLVEWLEPARTILREANVAITVIGQPEGEATQHEIKARIAELEEANAAVAPNWGAAVAARAEEIKELKAKLRREAPPC